MRNDLQRSSPGCVRQAGFTLIELMIVVAVVALLGAVALPAYNGSIMKSHRADARTALVTTAQYMERYATEHAGAGYSSATVNDTPGPTVVGKRTSDNGYYQLSLSNVTPTTFTLSAIPQGGQASDGCGNFTLNESGVRGVTGSSSGCW